MPDATCPVALTTFARLDGLGVVVTGQRLDPDRAVLACRVVHPDEWCRPPLRVRRVPPRHTLRAGWRMNRWSGAHDVVGHGAPLPVHRVRHVWRQDTTAAVEPKAKPSRGGLPVGPGRDLGPARERSQGHRGTGVAWNTAHDAIPAEGRRGRAQVILPDPRVRISEVCGEYACLQ